MKKDDPVLVVLDGHERLDNERFNGIKTRLARIEGILWMCAGTLIISGGGLIWTLMTSRINLAIYALQP